MCPFLSQIHRTLPSSNQLVIVSCAIRLPFTLILGIRDLSYKTHLALINFLGLRPLILVNLIA